MGRNMLVEGEWQTDVEPRTTDDGDFDRVETTFRDWIGDPPRDGRDRRSVPAEAGRYHLYISRSCPWAHGAALVRALRGLETAVSMDVVDPHRGADGWRFSPEKDGCTPDTATGSDHLREVYTAADPTYTGRVTVPVLWDRARETIVNNESIDIMRMLATETDRIADRDVDLYPEGYREDIDRIIEEIYERINNGVYRAGFAETQTAYDEAVTDVFDALDRWDEVLADRRYLAGDRLTLADLRLFPTLVRFDQVYHTKFYCDKRFLHQYEHLWPYLRDLYQTPGVAGTVRMDHIKEAYFTNSGEFTPDPIIPAGPDLEFTADHDRDRLPGEPPAL